MEHPRVRAQASIEGVASLHAEIIGQFDLVSVVELRDNLADLTDVLGILGPSWDVVFSDYISDAGGNHERIGFVFDRRAVTRG